MGLAVCGVVALLQHERPGKIRGQIPDLIVAEGVHVFGVGKRLAALLLGPELPGVVEAAGQQGEELVQFGHRVGPPILGFCLTVHPRAAVVKGLGQIPQGLFTAPQSVLY